MPGYFAIYLFKLFYRSAVAFYRFNSLHIIRIPLARFCLPQLREELFNFPGPCPINNTGFEATGRSFFLDSLFKTSANASKNDILPINRFLCQPDSGFVVPSDLRSHPQNRAKIVSSISNVHHTVIEATRPFAVEVCFEFFAYRSAVSFRGQRFSEDAMPLHMFGLQPTWQEC